MTTADVHTLAGQPKLKAYAEKAIRSSSKGESFARKMFTDTSANAIGQLAWAIALINAKDDRNGWTAVDLAHEIIQGQLERIAQFGDSAYPLSDKQVNVIVSAAFAR